MRNRFTITISDVRGIRQFTFQQFVKKFAEYFLLSVLLFWVFVAVSMVWYVDKTERVEQEHKQLISTYLTQSEQVQQEYEKILKEKRDLEVIFEEKTAKIDLLDQKLQDIEELVHGSEQLKETSQKDLVERLQSLQVSSMTKMALLHQIPSGPAVKKFTRISSSYGYRKHPVTGVRHKHSGMDYAGKTGDPVIATADGVVMFAGKSTNTGFGNLVSLSHNFGFKTRYGHLHKIYVKAGEFVRKGQVIAEIGNTGRSTGSHLHYEVLFLSNRINPKPFHDWSLENYDKIFTEVKRVPWASLVLATESVNQRVEKQLLQQDAKLMESLSE